MAIFENEEVTSEKTDTKNEVKAQTDDNELVMTLMKELKELKEAVSSTKQKEVAEVKEEPSVYEKIAKERKTKEQMAEEEYARNKEIEESASHFLSLEESYPQLSPMFNKVKEAHGKNFKDRLMSAKEVVISELGAVLKENSSIVDSNLLNRYIEFIQMNPLKRFDTINNTSLLQDIRSSYDMLARMKNEQKGSTILRGVYEGPKTKAEEYADSMFKKMNVKVKKLNK